jgi:hypothetical protein
MNPLSEITLNLLQKAGWSENHTSDIDGYSKLLGVNEETYPAL